MINQNRSNEEREEITLANLLISITPITWLALELVVGVKYSDNGHFEMPHQILSPEGHLRPVVFPDNDLFIQTKILYDVFRKRTAWVEMKMLVYYTGEAWAYKVNYRYS